MAIKHHPNINFNITIQKETAPVLLSLALTVPDGQPIVPNLFRKPLYYNYYNEEHNGHTDNNSTHRSSKTESFENSIL
jgi:hypothetical protein